MTPPLFPISLATQGYVHVFISCMHPSCVREMSSWLSSPRRRQDDEIAGSFYFQLVEGFLWFYGRVFHDYTMEGAWDQVSRTSPTSFPRLDLQLQGTVWVPSDRGNDRGRSLCDRRATGGRCD